MYGIEEVIATQEPLGLAERTTLMLGRGERESPEHSRLAAAEAGWSAGTEALLDLGSASMTLATVAAVRDMGAVMHVGHPCQPSHDLERALLAADPSLVVTSAHGLEAQWVWVGRSLDVTGTVVVDEAAMRDRRHDLRTMGASPHLVPSRTSVEKRVELAGRDGSLVIERSRIPEGFVELPGSERLRQGAPIWYGLVEATSRIPQVHGPAQVWLAFGPRDDYRGSLQQTLGVFAEAGVDLQHLRSHRTQAGPHVFFSSFSCPGAGLLTDVVAAFTSRGVSHRVLAVMPGSRFEPGPDAVEPQWPIGHVDATS